MRCSAKIFSVAAIAAYPILLHLAVLSDNNLAITLSLCIAFVFYLTLILKHSPKPRPLPIILILSASVLILAFRDMAARYVLISIPFLINIFLFVVFGRTLLAGREPLIAQISRHERGGIMPVELVTYTRRLTLVWTAYFAGAAIASLVLARYASLATWSTFANLANYVGLAVLFVGEYVYRLARFPHLPHASPLRVIGRLVRDGMPGASRSLR